MRRGHPSTNTWRNDIPRHFRPRGGGGMPHFRPSRGYGLLEPNRFPPPGSRPLLNRPFNVRPGLIDDSSTPEHHVRHTYRSGLHNNQQHRPQDRNHHFGNRQVFPLLQRMRQNDASNTDRAPYQDNRNYYDNQNKSSLYHVNNMGDVDHRQSIMSQNRESFSQHPSPWSVPPPDYEERFRNDHYGRQDSNEYNKRTLLDYTGHRPPSSDHYGGNGGSVTDNSNTFSRSVNDTVDIVRKKLLNRDSQPPHPDNAPREQIDVENKVQETTNFYEVNQQEQPVIKRKIHRQRQTVKLNCDKIKNKIVHQLFMMDKDKIHKLMDNPNSSSKFEFAISSLITESQNNFNRHLRSVAEQSLCSSSTEFMHNHNNTIYEDTFMKQMQCLLDPQDTVLLEDIKPMVLAELSKVLQLDDFDQKHDTIDEHAAYPCRDESSKYSQYPSDEYNYDYNYTSFESCSPRNNHDSSIDTNLSQIEYNRSESASVSSDSNRNHHNDQEIQSEPKCLFERRQARKSSDYKRDRRRSHEGEMRRKERRSIDSKVDDEKSRKCDSELSEENIERSNTPLPIHFDVDTNQNLEEKMKLTGISRPPNLNAHDQWRCDSSRLDSEGHAEQPERKLRRSDSLRSNINIKGEHPLEDHFRNSDRPEDKCKTSDTPTLPLFNVNTEHLSDDEDPFADLDNQYHVAVDPNFIATDDLTCSRSPILTYNRPDPPIMNTECIVKSPPNIVQDRTPEKKQCNVKTPDNNSSKIEQEIDNQLKVIAKSPLKLCSSVRSRNGSENDNQVSEKVIKQELFESHKCSNQIEGSEPKQVDKSHLNSQQTPEPILVENTEKSETCMIKSSARSNSRKRSIDLKPSHRKEKRKKTESSQPADANKQILNKNLIINVSDCMKSEKSDCPNSIFNLFFSKNQNDKDKSKENKSDEIVEKGYSDKYVKRKETPKKQKEKESESKKKHDSNFSTHSMLSPTNSVCSSVGQSSTKLDAKTKLKSIDMFSEQPRKLNIHQSHRNTAPAPTTTGKTAVEFKSKLFMATSRKITRRHVGTQVIRKSTSTETQTHLIELIPKTCQTDKKKLTTRGVQTIPVLISSNSKSGSGDAFERMKEIDMEIQTLLQEKFKLYSSLESKESGTNTIQSLGMAVLNVSSFDSTKTTGDNQLSEDTIVDEFTSIPVEDLEQIALETAQEQSDTLTIDKRSHRKRARQQERKNSESSTTSLANTRIKKNKAKTPNISLIEQIITDDRPLEDIISLAELEATPVKSKKKTKSTRKQKKKSSKKAKIAPNIKYQGYDIKECSIILMKIDINKYLQSKSKDSETAKVSMGVDTNIEQESHFLEETVLNDLQFDMLDVSEDIVIGDDIGEMKSIGGKNANILTPSVCEEIILDNSQSSVEDTATAEPGPSENQCKTFDYSADENLRRDSITVTGNGDAVLAIECIDNNFIAACLDGNVYYFNGDGQLINTLRGSNLAVTCLTIVKEKYGTTVYTGSLDSRIRYYDLETGLEKGPECNVLSPIQTMDCAWDTIFVGTKTGFVLQFECKNNMLIPVSTVKFSEQSILALRAMKEGPRKVLLVAARSEPVAIKDAQTGLLLRTLEGPKMTVYTLLLEDGKVYCGTSSHQIHVFDYASGSHVGSHEGGKGAVCLRATGGLLFAGCYDGCVYIYRDGETTPLAQLRGPSLMLLSLAIVGSKIIAGYKDRGLYIWKIPLTILEEMIL